MRFVYCVSTMIPSDLRNDPACSLTPTVYFILKVIHIIDSLEGSDFVLKVFTMTSLHPLIDNGLQKGDSNKAGGKLHCRCHGATRVEVVLGANVAFNHLCGCSKCWRPQGALFSLVGVVPRDKVHVTSGADKLKIVDRNAPIQRNACTGCGVHMFGRIEQDVCNPLKAFHG